MDSLYDQEVTEQQLGATVQSPPSPCPTIFQLQDTPCSAGWSFPFLQTLASRKETHGQESWRKSHYVSSFTRTQGASTVEFSQLLNTLREHGGHKTNGVSSVNSQKWRSRGCHAWLLGLV